MRKKNEIYKRGIPTTKVRTYRFDPEYLRAKPNRLSCLCVTLNITVVISVRAVHMDITPARIAKIKRIEDRIRFHMR